MPRYWSPAGTEFTRLPQLSRRRAPPLAGRRSQNDRAADRCRGTTASACQAKFERTRKGCRMKGRTLLWRPRDSLARAFRHHPEAIGERRLPADHLAPDALLRALWTQGLRPLPRLPRRPDPRVLSELPRGDVERLRDGPRWQAHRTAAARSRTGASPSSTPACTPTSGQRLLRVRSFLDGEEMFLANYSRRSDRLRARTVHRQFVQRGATAGFWRAPIAELPCGQPTRRLGRWQRRSSTYEQVRHWINGGFFCLRKRFSTTSTKAKNWSKQPFQRLMAQADLWAQRHDGFWAQWTPSRTRSPSIGSKHAATARGWSGSAEALKE